MRRTGRSTRILDRCIQQLFTNDKTYLYHYNRTINETERLMEKFKARMHLEHPHEKFSSRLVKEDGITCYLIERHDL